MLTKPAGLLLSGHCLGCVLLLLVVGGGQSIGILRFQRFLHAPGMLLGVTTQSCCGSDTGDEVRRMQLAWKASSSKRFHLGPKSCVVCNSPRRDFEAQPPSHITQQLTLKHFKHRFETTNTTEEIAGAAAHGPTTATPPFKDKFIDTKLKIPRYLVRSRVMHLSDVMRDVHG